MNFFKKKLLFSIFFSVLCASFLFSGENERVSFGLDSHTQHEGVNLSYLQSAIMNMPKTNDLLQQASNREQLPNSISYKEYLKGVFQPKFHNLYKDFIPTLQAFRELKEEQLASFENELLAQRLNLSDDQRVALLSDIHGNFHILVNILCYWRDELKVMDNNFKFTQKNFNVIVLGDMVDRGLYNVEVLYVLMRLYIENPDRVIILRGNHEDIDMNEPVHNNGSKLSLNDELDIKVQVCSGEDKIELLEIDECIYRWLPMTCYVNIHGKIIQCCHATPDILYNPCLLFAGNDAYAEIQINNPVSALSDDVKNTFYARIIAAEQISLMSSISKKGSDIVGANFCFVNALCNFMAHVLQKTPVELASVIELQTYFKNIKEGYMQFDVRDLYDAQNKLHTIYCVFIEEVLTADHLLTDEMRKEVIKIQNFFNGFVHPYFEKLNKTYPRYVSFINAINTLPATSLLDRHQPDLVSSWFDRETIDSWSMLWSDIDVPGGAIHNPARKTLQYSQEMISHVLKMHGVFAVCRGHQHNGKMFELLEQFGGIAGLWNVDNSLLNMPISQDSVFTFYSQHGEGAFGLLHCIDNTLCIEKHVMPSLNRFGTAPRAPLRDLVNEHQ